MAQSKNKVFTTTILVSVLLVGCATQHQTSLPASPDVYWQSAQQAMKMHVDCIVAEAEKKAFYSASASEIADAVVSVCDNYLASYKSEMLNYFRAKYRSPNAISTGISGLETSVTNTRTKARNLAVSIVLEKRAGR